MMLYVASVPASTGRGLARTPARRGDRAKKGNLLGLIAGFYGENEVELAELFKPALPAPALR